MGRAGSNPDAGRAGGDLRPHPSTVRSRVAVKIRLMRVGKKKQPSYRVVVADARSPRDGRYIEIVGQYRPRAEPSEFVVDDEKVLAWLGRGAQPTEQVHRLLVAAGLWERYEAGRSRPSRTARRAGAREIGRSEARRRRSEAEAAAARADASAAGGEAAEPAGDGPAADAEGGE